MATPPEMKKQPPSPTFGNNCKRLADKKKLVLCQARSSKEFIFQKELKSIMETLGFVCVSDAEEDANSAWVEYIFPAIKALPNTILPKPTLPGNRIDGLHVYTYIAFLDAVNYYLRMDNLCNLFIIRRTPIRLPPDARLTWRLAEIKNIESFVYRACTLKQEVYDFYDRQGMNGISRIGCARGSGTSEPSSCSSGICTTDGSTSTISISLEDLSVTGEISTKNDSHDDDYMQGTKDENADFFSSRTVR